MPNKQLVKHKTAASLDKKSGSLAYNRFEMQISQTLHMAIELYSNLNYLLVLDHYDDITLFDDDVTPETVSYYQMKTSEDSISIDTAISEAWVAKLYEQLSDPQWIIKELGLITNCPLKVSVKFKGDDGKTHSEERKYTAERTPFQSFNPYMVNKLKQDIAQRKGISANDGIYSQTFLSVPPFLSGFLLFCACQGNNCIHAAIQVAFLSLCKAVPDCIHFFHLLPSLFYFFFCKDFFYHCVSPHFYFSSSSASSFAVLLSCFISLFNFFTLFRVFLYPVIFTLTVCITGFSIVFSSPLFLTRAIKAAHCF